MINNIFFWVDGSSPWSTTLCFEWTTAAPDQRHYVLSGRQQPMINDIMFWVDGSNPWSTTLCFEWTTAAPDQRHYVLSGRQQPLITFCFEWTTAAPDQRHFIRWMAVAPDLQHSVLSGRQQPLINDILFWVDGSSPWSTFCFEKTAVARFKVYSSDRVRHLPLIIAAIQFPSISSPQHHVIVFIYMIYLFL